MHPGGPYWTRRDEGAWSIPKGEIDAGEEPLAAAQREFEEETGAHAEGPFLDLGTCRQRSGKRVRAYAAEGDLDADGIRSNAMTMEWPPHSGRLRSFPEVDRAGWFTLDQARAKLIEGQCVFLDAIARVAR